MKRTKISNKDVDIGIYKTPYGFAVCWRDGGKPREKHFAPDTPVPNLRDFRKERVKNAAPAPPKDGMPAGGGSFTRDVVRYLKFIKHKPHFKSTRSHLRPWCKRFGRFSRHVIDAQKIEIALAEWSDKSPRELRHRVNALRQVFMFLDRRPGPCVVAQRGVEGGVRLPKVPKTDPQGVPDDIIATVAAKLQDQERKGRLRDGKTRARFLVLATTGRRPCQMRRAKPTEVDFVNRVWWVTPAKNSKAGPCYLNDEMLGAWLLFRDAHAWGHYNHDSFCETLHRNGWPTDVRPYQMRHQTGQTMSDRGVDIGFVQVELGHESILTTRRSYVPGRLKHAKMAAEAIEGRFTEAIFSAREHTPRRPSRRKKAIVLPMPLSVDPCGPFGSEPTVAAAPYHQGIPSETTIADAVRNGKQAERLGDLQLGQVVGK